MLKHLQTTSCGTNVSAVLFCKFWFLFAPPVCWRSERGCGCSCYYCHHLCLRQFYDDDDQNHNYVSQLRSVEIHVIYLFQIYQRFCHRITHINNRMFIVMHKHTYTVSQILLWQTKKLPHSIKFSDFVTSMIPLHSRYKVPEQESLVAC